MVLVRWQRSPQENLNTSWFEQQDVAVTIDNEAFGITVINSTDNKETNVPSIDDVLEERHRHTDNEGYQELPLSPSPRLAPPVAPATHKLLRTSSSMKHMYSSPSHSTNSTPDKRSSSLQRAHSSMSHQYALLRGKLDHTNKPAVQSYRSRATGIPHHPTSKFFRNVSQKMYLPPPSSIPPATYVNQSPSNTIRTGHSRQAPIRRTHSAMLSAPLHHSPTMHSIRSESAAFRPIPGQPLIHSSSGPALHVFHHDGIIPHQFSNRPLPELPSTHYEVPVPIKQNLPQLPEERTAPVYAEVDSANNTMPEGNQPAVSAHITLSCVRAIVPRIESSTPSKVEVELGTSTMLSCQVRSATPLTYEWRKNGQKVSQNG